MLSLDNRRQYYLWRGRTDMRIGMDSLSGLVLDGMGRDPRTGDVFIFINKRGNHLKLLVWDITGYVLYWKRLEAGAFEFPQSDNPELSWTQLVLILEGIDLKSIKQRKRLKKN